MMPTQLFLTVLVLHQAQLVKQDYIVSISLETKDVVFGNDVDLLCSVSGLVTKQTRQWAKFEQLQDLTVISFDGVITKNKHKYEEKLVVHNETLHLSYLTIHSFSEYDLRIYRCYYGAKETEIALNLNENMTYLPDENSNVTYNFDQSSRSVDIILTIPKVYPEPFCQITIKDKEIHFSVAQTVKMGEFFNALFQKQLLIDQDDCDYVSILCAVGSHRWINKINKSICWKGENNGNLPHWAIVIIILCLVISIGFPAVLLLVQE